MKIHLPKIALRHFCLCFVLTMFVALSLGAAQAEDYAHPQVEEEIVAQDAPVQSRNVQNNEMRIKMANGEELLFTVELAVTGAEQEQGLMNRTSMPLESGMLFLFPEERKRTFWMKDTLIPLDILFLARDGEIHHIHSMAKPQSEALITSEASSFAVLEINGGQADKLGIAVGDKVFHPVFRNVLAP